MARGDCHPALDADNWCKVSATVLARNAEPHPNWRASEPWGASARMNTCEAMPPPNPPSSSHADASDAKIHKLAYGFGQYEFWPRPTLACRAADNAGTHYPADCNVRAGFSAHWRCATHKKQQPERLPMYPAAVRKQIIVIPP